MLDYFAKLKGIADKRERRSLVEALLEKVNLSSERNGHNHWLYNPVLYKLWTYADLIEGPSLPAIVWRRAVWLAAAIAALALTHLFFQRKSTSGPVSQNRLQ